MLCQVFLGYCWPLPMTLKVFIFRIFFSIVFFFGAKISCLYSLSSFDLIWFCFCLFLFFFSLFFFLFLFPFPTNLLAPSSGEYSAFSSLEQESFFFLFICFFSWLTHQATISCIVSVVAARATDKCHVFDTHVPTSFYRFALSHDTFRCFQFLFWAATCK